ncbi:glycine cleavage system P-protein-domain-containing protein [Globomyces pollinis-pini]|nr:glycine cleavage system P-protein-domain-containing protein [Globomyces pollinis-pini]
MSRFLKSIRIHSRTFNSTPKYYSIFNALDTFDHRHIGPNNSEIIKMCSKVNATSLDDLVNQTVPTKIHIKNPTRLGNPLSESETIARISDIAKQNKIFRSYLGMGYYASLTPAVILRNIMENPGWYTQYTPYQPEISQGRLESLVNYQTMVTNLTGLDVANASLLDEGTAAGEAMLLCYSAANRKKNVFFVDSACFPQTIACLQTRAEGFGIQVVVQDFKSFDFAAYSGNVVGALIQYPNANGDINDYEAFVKKAHENGALVACATDLMALALLKPPGEFGVDIALGNSQRFGIPLGYGGPHAAFFAVKDALKRRMPGRLVGLSKDAQGLPAYRLALQTREQHIRREKATSNICTAQALLANMAGMYAVYHGPTGIKNIAQRIHNLTAVLANAVTSLGHTVVNTTYFDTLTIKLTYPAKDLIEAAEKKEINIRYIDDSTVGISLDETVKKQDLVDLINLFATSSFVESFQHGKQLTDYVSMNTIEILANSLDITTENGAKSFPSSLVRTSTYLDHPVFNTYHSETEMLRYMYHLQKKDLSLADAMIPLGSCTMKLNSTVEMIPVTMPEFGNIHPFVPKEQAKGYEILFKELEYALSEATGFEHVSLQPNSGAQGEYAGLRCIKAYLESIGQGQRNVCLIPVSAHGTNPASAVMSGMKVVTVACDELGNLDLEDLEKKAVKYADTLAATMITYPSTYGVFEETIVAACEIIHRYGGQVYMDGANLNAQMGLCKPGEMGADVCHLNLHKTFCIPHGGGGPGMGPIGVRSHLGPFLPGHPVVPCGGTKALGPISAAPWGSASILTISWAYLKLMGDDGLRKATQVALLNANYMMYRLQEHYPILYTNKNNKCAHEFIIDCRPFAATSGIEAIDIAKRLHDYGFHSPTMSFPVSNTLMIEPTESESLSELDRFCDAMISIRAEIAAIENGKASRTDNVLVNAPHPMHVIMADEWTKPYSRQVAAYPMEILRKGKFWPTVSRVDDTYGDRNLICSCPPLEAYE